ncbi:hypothetical protein [Cupriavidus agavae]|uniref:Uncharacterized protein n=1 Tax=Cupriavidus agavae TaxID=1001822 RepID=A0A4Q7S5P2_9BURK|nr:hypothetical protein [Cupriavidus agavae]RZT41167.1 hypothetical protein EV147_0153 [Cupriavidus agavae]
MAMVEYFFSEFRQLRTQAAEHGDAQARDAARLRRKVVRKEVGMAIVALGATVMFLDAARGLSFLAT